MDTNGVNAEVDRGNGNHDVIHSSWIVGCDGGHSTVRENLGLKMRGTTMPGCFWLGEFDVDWKRSRDTLYEWWHKDGIAVAVYIDFTQKWHVFVERRDGVDEEPDLGKMNALFRQRTGGHTAQLRNPAWINTLKVNQRLPDHFIVGRAILAGDAAHVHSAAGGQGMNTGMQDALNLGWKLALTVSSEAAPTLLQTYQLDRWPNARAVLRATQTFHHIEIPHGVIGQWIGGTIFKAMQSVSPFGNAAFARVLLFAGVSPINETVEAMRKIDRTLAPLNRHLHTHPTFALEADAEAAGLSGTEAIIDGAKSASRFWIERARNALCQTGWIHWPSDSRRRRCCFARLFKVNLRRRYVDRRCYVVALALRRWCLFPSVRTRNSYLRSSVFD
jgi:FAD binding domain